MGGKRFSEITIALDADDRLRANVLATHLLNVADTTTVRAGITRAITSSKIQSDVEITLTGFGHPGLLADALSAYGLHQNLMVKIESDSFAPLNAASEIQRVHLIRFNNATDAPTLLTRLDVFPSKQVLLVPDPGTSVAVELDKYPLLDAAEMSGLSAQQWIDDRQLGDELPMLTIDAAKRLAQSAIIVIRSRLEIADRPACKMIITDLDNTLWGGIVGEDGATDLEMDKNDSVDHGRYQRMLKKLTLQGVLLVAVSRNRPEDVKQVFATSHDMGLNENDFLTIDASWEPKAQTIARILSSAQIAPEAAVFIDDDPLEQRQVASALPSLLVPTDGHQPDQALARLMASGLFASQATTEDKTRTYSTRASMRLSQDLQSTNNRSSILKSLGIKISFEPLDESNRSRAHQLAERVTQFRTAKTPDHWEAPDRHVFLAKLHETGMDHGRIGLVIWRQSGTCAILELLCLSCRALNRDVDSVLIGEIIRHAKDAGLESIEAPIEKLARNEPARDLFLRHDFAEVSPSLFRRGLHDIPTPDHIVIDAEGATKP